MSNRGGRPSAGGARGDEIPEWRSKPMRRWSKYDVYEFVKQIGTAEFWSDYADSCLEEQFDGATLATFKNPEIAVKIGFGEIHAQALAAAVGEALGDADTPPPPELKVGMRILVRSRGTQKKACLMEGRLVEVKRAPSGNWTLRVEAPLGAAATYRFRYSGHPEDYLIIPPPEETPMQVGTRVVSCFGDGAIRSGWAWYEGDVMAWDGKQATVRYSDGTCWTTSYPQAEHLLDIKDSESLLTREFVSGLNPGEAPIIPIYSPPNARKTSSSTSSSTARRVAAAPVRCPAILRRGCRVLVRSFGYKNTPCFMEGRLVRAEPNESKEWVMQVAAPLCGPTRQHRFVFRGAEWQDEKKASGYLIPPEKDETMGTGARVLSCFEDDKAAGGWAWYEGKVTEYDDAKGVASIRYVDGVAWKTFYPCRKDMLEPQTSERRLTRKLVTALDPCVMPLIVVGRGRDAQEELKTKQEALRNALASPSVAKRVSRAVKAGRRILIRGSGYQGPRTCYYEGRINSSLFDKKEKDWILMIRSPLTASQQGEVNVKQIKVTTDISSFIIPPVRQPATLRPGNIVMAPFGDPEAKAGWAWYTGTVTDVSNEGKVATVTYSDGTKWTSRYPARNQSILDINGSERQLTRETVSSLDPGELPLIFLGEADTRLLEFGVPGLDGSDDDDGDSNDASSGENKQRGSLLGWLFGRKKTGPEGDGKARS